MLRIYWHGHSGMVMFTGEMRMEISAKSQIYRSVVEGGEGDPGSGGKIL